MRKYSKIITAIALFASLGVMSSCTKEDGVFKEGGSNGIIQLDLPSNESAAKAYPLKTVSFDAAASIDFPIEVQYLGTEGAPSDITVTLATSDAVLASYNTSASTSFVVLDPSLYTIPSNTVVIPKGGKSATFIIKLKTSSFDFTKSYALGLGIKSVSAGVISGNYGTGVFRVVAKNAYEASYTTTGWLFHPTAGRALNATYAVSTTGVSTCSAPVGDLGGSGYTFGFTVTGSAVGSFVPTGSTPTGTQSGFFSTDQPSASATWVNSAGTSQPGVAPYVHSTYNNTYDAASKTFYLHYGYGSGASGQTGWSRQIYAKMVRK